MKHKVKLIDKASLLENISRFFDGNLTCRVVLQFIILYLPQDYKLSLFGPWWYFDGFK